ncbi:CocE/NonD family hydrolase C-terminal non-catalytic domain-containing protein [Mesorhizobium sp. M0847]|uniref:CocE/NonD family hydrolase C-terminal non-catalytic domain-containing protein n=1 Tax=unclassified Mesorhizobium TaxID=325217 RepID=UPI00333C6B36
MTPGKPEAVRMKLRCCGQRFEKGQRIRLAIATGRWPIVFPSPERATLSIYCAASNLILPDSRLAQFAEPEGARPMAREVVKPSEPSRQEITTGPVTRETMCRLSSDTGAVLHPHSGLNVSAKHTDTFTIHPDAKHRRYVYTR